MCDIWKFPLDELKQSIYTFLSQQTNSDRFDGFHTSPTHCGFNIWSEPLQRQPLKVTGTYTSLWHSAVCLITHPPQTEQMKSQMKNEACIWSLPPVWESYLKRPRRQPIQLISPSSWSDPHCVRDPQRSRRYYFQSQSSRVFISSLVFWGHGKAFSASHLSKLTICCRVRLVKKLFNCGDLPFLQVLS